MTTLTEPKRHAICLAALEAKKDLEWKGLELGKMLYEIKLESHFLAGWTSWEEYCMELKMSPTSISKLLRIYEVFSLHYAIPQEQLAAAGGWSTLAELLPVIKPETTPVKRVRELLGIATEQSRKHLRETIFEAKKGSPCAHKKTRFLVLEICEDGCGERWNVTDNYKLSKA